MTSTDAETRRLGDEETGRPRRFLLVSRSPRLHLFAAISIIAAVLGGCSSGAMESQVSGRVTLDGEPIGPGIVSFVPAGEKHNPAIGAPDADGVYSLKTSRTDGLPAGHYRVSVYVHKMPPGAQPGERLMSTPSAIPDRYENVETSGLEFDVQPGSNTIDIVLTSKQ
jgi:hypothetical protein